MFQFLSQMTLALEQGCIRILYASPFFSLLGKKAESLFIIFHAYNIVVTISAIALLSCIKESSLFSGFFTEICVIICS